MVPAEASSALRRLSDHVTAELMVYISIYMRINFVGAAFLDQVTPPT